MSGIFGPREYREQLSFGKCPVCGGELARGRANVLHSSLLRTPWITGFVATVGWYNEDKVQKALEKTIRLSPLDSDAETYADLTNQCPIPAGYCVNCKKIFAEFDIKSKDEPIGYKYNDH